MMALSALSMAHHNGYPSAHALEHYQQVIPGLKAMVQSSQDSYSDGAFLCHFLLLLYEVSHDSRGGGNRLSQRKAENTTSSFLIGERGGF